MLTVAGNYCQSLICLSFDWHSYCLENKEVHLVILILLFFLIRQYVCTEDLGDSFRALYIHRDGPEGKKAGSELSKSATIPTIDKPVGSVK